MGNKNTSDATIHLGFQEEEYMGQGYQHKSYDSS